MRQSINLEKSQQYWDALDIYKGVYTASVKNGSQQQEDNLTQKLGIQLESQQQNNRANQNAKIQNQEKKQAYRMGEDSNFNSKMQLNTYERLSQSISILGEIIINKDKKLLHQEGCFTKHGIEMTLRSKEMTLLTQKSTLKVNSSFKAGGLTVNPMNKKFGFKHQITILKSEFDEIFSISNDQTLKPLKLELTMSTLKFQSHRYLVQLGQFSLGESQIAFDLLSQSIKLKPLQSVILQEFELLKRTTTSRTVGEFSNEEKQLLVSPSYTSSQNGLCQYITIKHPIQELKDQTNAIIGGQSYVRSMELVFDLKELPGESSYKSQAKEVINQQNSTQRRRFMAIKFPLDGFQEKMRNQIMILKYIDNYYKTKMPNERPPFFPQSY